MEVNSKLIQRPPEALMWVLQVPSVAKHLAAVHVSSRWTVLNRRKLALPAAHILQFAHKLL